MFNTAAYAPPKDEELYRSRHFIRSTPKIACDDVVTGGIALLSDQDVDLMTREDVLDAVQAAQSVPHFPIEAKRIASHDDERLRKVLYAVRRWMRRRCDMQSRGKGLIPYFQE